MTGRFQPPAKTLAPAVTTEVSQPFWEACTLGELIYQRCAICDTANFPPAEHCRNCLSGSLEWEISAGTGRLYSWTIVHRPVTPAFVTPYAPAIVTLDEGYSMVTNIVGAEPAELHADLALTVVFHQVDSRHIPYFQPTSPPARRQEPS